MDNTDTTTEAAETTAPDNTPNTGTEPGNLLATGELAPPAMPEAAPEKPEWLPDKYWHNSKANYEALAKSHSGLEQLLGKKANAIMVPNEKSSPEEVAAYRKALGVPEGVDEYLTKLKPEVMPEGVEFDDNLAKMAAEIAHKHNVPPAALKELANLQMLQMSGMTKAVTEQAMAQLNEAKQDLAATYGDKLNEKLDVAKRVAASAEPPIPADDPMWRSPNAIRFANWVSQIISDDKLISADALGSSVAGGEVKAKDIQTNPDNPYYQRYQDGDAEIVDLVRRYRQQG